MNLPSRLQIAESCRPRRRAGALHRAPDRRPTPAPSFLRQDHPRPPGHLARGQRLKRRSPAGHGSGVPVAVQPEELCLPDMIGGYIDHRAVIGQRHVRVRIVLIDAMQDDSWIANGLGSLVHRHRQERIAVREHEMARPGVTRWSVAAAAQQSSSLSRLTRQHIEPGSVGARACDEKVVATRYSRSQ